MTLVLRREPNDKVSLEMSRWIEAELAEGVPASARPARKKDRDVPGPSDAVDISFVVPVQDAEATLIDLYERVAAELPDGTTFEVILIDDGSRDRSWEVIGIMARCEPARVRGLRFQSRAGLARSLAAGFGVARGQVIFTLNADLQDDLSEIDRFLDKLGEGFDIVGRRIKNRHDPSGTFFSIRIFHHMLRGILRVLQRDPECGLKCWRCQVARKLTIFAEPHWMVRDPAELDGFHVAEIEVERPPRRPDLSKHGFKQSIRDIIKTFTAGFLQKNRERSAHLLGVILAYHGAAAAALLAGAVILVAVHSPTAAAVALLLVDLILGRAFLASIRGRFRQLSICGGPRIGTRPLIVEDTAARRRSGKNRTHR